MIIHNTIRLGLAVGLSLAVTAAIAQTTPRTGTPAASNSRPAAAQQAPESADSVFQRMDKNGDKMLSLEEFKTGVEMRNREILLERLQEQFKTMDLNHDTFLQANEYSQLPLVKRYGASAPGFTDSDTNHDQKLDFREYINLISKFANSRQGKP